MKTTLKKLGVNFRRIRIKRGMSQGDISRKLKMDRSYISSVEKGKRNPTLTTIKKLADALGVSVNELLK